jgi:hypothetical protein
MLVVLTIPAVHGAKAQSLSLGFGPHYNFSSVGNGIPGYEVERNIGVAVELYRSGVAYTGYSRHIGLRVFYNWTRFADSYDYRDKRGYSLTGIMANVQQPLWRHKRFVLLAGFGGGVGLRRDIDGGSGQVIDWDVPSGTFLIQPGLYAILRTGREFGLQASVHPTVLVMSGEMFPYDWGVQVYVGIILSDDDKLDG